jgi:ATP-binding protein involved in chromosome partitioning
MAISREQVMAALRHVTDPELFKDIVTLNLVKGVRLEGNHVFVNLELNSPDAAQREAMKRTVEKALRAHGADAVTIDQAGASRPAASGPAGQDSPPRSVLPQVKNVVAVGAGKGGVGKSTLAVNLAVALQRLGSEVGLMDGDIYGPSMPTLLGLKGQRPMMDGQKLIPFAVHGIHAITIGALVPEDKPLIWRGPMAHGAFKQLLLDNTIWPALDYLIVDLPPGTGDVPLSLCQLLPLTGAVVVATPQQVALDDAIRAVRMFQQLESPVLGMVENMSYLVTADGSTIDIFGKGGAELAAQKMRLPFLGALPLFPELRINSDAGDPHKNFEGNPLLRDALMKIAEALAEQVRQQNTQSKGPELTII